MSQLDVKEFAKGLSPELKAKAAACQSPEELIGLAEEYGMELPESVLEAISGGDMGTGRRCNHGDSTNDCPKNEGIC